MPDWTTPWDPFNNTVDKQKFNPYGVRKITKRIIDIYLPYEECAFCEAIRYGDKTIKPMCYGSKTCLVRLKDYKSGKCHVLTKGFRQWPSLNILIGTLIWNYEHGLNFIFRATVENGFEMHHIKINPYDNRFESIAMVDKIYHIDLHIKLRSLIRKVGELTVIASQEKYPKYRLIELDDLSKTYEDLRSGVTDSPRVFDVIGVIDMVLSGHYTAEKGQSELVKLHAATPEISIVKGYINDKEILPDGGQLLHAI